MFEWKSHSLRQKETRQVKSKAKSMLMIFFDIKGIVFKEFVLEVQIVNSKLWGQRAGCCIMTTCCLTLLFSPGNFLPKIT
jgi:hypothetical protein